MKGIDNKYHQETLTVNNDNVDDKCAKGNNINEKIDVVENISNNKTVDSSDDKKRVLTYTCLCCIVYVEEAEDSVSEYRGCTCDTQGLGICVSILKNTSYMLLLVIKFLAQLVTLPLLLL